MYLFDEGQRREPTRTIVIITKWIDSVESYIEAKRDVKVKRPEKCPACGQENIIFWSGYFRYVVINADRSDALFIHRILCKSCDTTHSLLPWFILTRRTHLAHLIGYALYSKIIKKCSTRSIAKDLGLSRSTIRGWIKRFEYQVENLYHHCLFLIRSISERPPPGENQASGTITALFKLFTLTQFSKDLFWAYVSLITRGRFLTNTTSPFHSR